MSNKSTCSNHAKLIIDSKCTKLTLLKIICPNNTIDSTPTKGIKSLGSDTIVSHLELRTRLKVYFFFNMQHINTSIHPIRTNNLRN